MLEQVWTDTRILLDVQKRWYFTPLGAKLDSHLSALAEIAVNPSNSCFRPLHREPAGTFQMKHFTRSLMLINGLLPRIAFNLTFVRHRNIYTRCFCAFRQWLDRPSSCPRVETEEAMRQMHRGPVLPAARLIAGGSRSASFSGNPSRQLRLSLCQIPDALGRPSGATFVHHNHPFASGPLTHAWRARELCALARSNLSQ